MPGKTRKFAQLSPQKHRQSPAKYVKLTEHDDDSERREATANKIAKGHQRNRSIIDNSYPSPRKAPGAGAPGTPSRVISRGGFGNSSPLPKLPILANFEEWMKMATDNKINAGNSWNFALIDYFHEMSLLKEGNSINFQKASVTLDGCVKIYTNRVDSVATETGKLLSGLSTRKVTEGDEEETGDPDEEESETRKQKKKTKTSAGSTLMKDFSALQAKKMDMEFFVDPLFKKTSAEFDEGGAKGLLLNHLCVDREGRIIFDASDACNDAQNEEEPVVEEHDDTLDVESLRQRFFPELLDDEEQFENLHICPFLKNFKSDSTVVDIPLLTNFQPGTDNEALNFDGAEEDEGLNGIVDVYDDNENAAFGEVAEINIPYQENEGFNEATGKGTATGSENFLQMGGDAETMFSQFDNLLRKNWAGPSNWKITRLNNATTSEPVVKKPRKEKEVSVIDFYSDEAAVDEDLIFAPGGSSITMPKSQWTTKSRNLLPEDKHFNSESLLRLFLKPKAKIGSRKTITRSDEGQDEGRFVDMDENFWAKKNDEPTPDVDTGYNADFFNDGEDNGDGPDQDHFEDAKQDFNEQSDFGSQLQELNKNRKSEYVNYAKAAKKVDVRVLKENIWNKLELPTLSEAIASDSLKQVDDRKFTEVVKDLTNVYPEKALSEISTSFCFICLLHLANEQGLEITGEENMTDLSIRRDTTVRAIEAV